MNEMEKKRAEFKKLTDPVIKFLNENFHPHVKVIIDVGSAELVEGKMAHRTEEFFRD